MGLYIVIWQLLLFGKRNLAVLAVQTAVLTLVVFGFAAASMSAQTSAQTSPTSSWPSPLPNLPQDNRANLPGMPQDQASQPSQSSHSVQARAQLQQTVSVITTPETGLRPQITPTYTLTGAVQLAIKNYPSIKSAQRKKESFDAGISLAKTSYLPHIDLLWQELRGSQNVIAGQILPQEIDVIPIQSGAPSHSSTFNSIWSNNEGTSLAWEVWDFGLRHSKVGLAKSESKQAQAITGLTELDVQFAAADAYLTTVAANETIRANQANYDRFKAWGLVVHTLVDKGLRAGIDAARADAELSLSKIALIDAQKDTELARADLAEAMGIADTYVNIISQPIIQAPRSSLILRTPDLSQHPLALVKAAAVETAAARVHVLDRSYYPHFWLHASLFSRGSGVTTDPRRVAAGILPQTANWVTGFSMSFPAFDIFAIKAERRMQYKNELAQKADYDLVLQELGRKDARARVLVEKTQQVAAETLTLVYAAKENEIKARERYRVGLCNVVEVAEAERILANAEVQAAIAQVAVWRAILQASYVHGDLRPFLNLVAQSEAAAKVP